MKGIQWIALAFGLAALALSVLLALVLFLSATIGGASSSTSTTVIAFSLAAVGGGLGIALAVAAWRGLQARPATPLALPGFWLLLLLFAVLLATGELIRSTMVAPALLPLVHVLASLVPILALVALVVRPLQRAAAGLTRRDLARQLAFGGLVATLLALVTEGIVLLGAAVVGAGLLAALPGGNERLEYLASVLQSPSALEDLQSLMELVNLPLLALAGGLVLAVLAPAVEEVAKSLGVWMTGIARGRLSQAQAFALGVMAGVGFSLVEAVFNGAALLPHSWAGPVATRAGTAVIHGLASGLMGLGWHALLTGRGRLPFLGFALAAMGLHGLWNGLGGLLAVTELYAMDAGSSVFGSGLAVLATVLLVLTFSIALAILFWLPRKLAARLGHHPLEESGVGPVEPVSSS